MSYILAGCLCFAYLEKIDYFASGFLTHACRSRLCVEVEIVEILQTYSQLVRHAAKILILTNLKVFGGY